MACERQERSVIGSLSMRLGQTGTLSFLSRKPRLTPLCHAFIPTNLGQASVTQKPVLHTAKIRSRPSRTHQKWCWWHEFYSCLTFGGEISLPTNSRPVDWYGERLKAVWPLMTDSPASVDNKGALGCDHKPENTKRKNKALRNHSS